MKKSMLAYAALLLLAAACSKSGTEMASPNSDAGIDQHNTVVNARPDTSAGAAAAGTSGVASSDAVKSSRAETNMSAKPQHPPAR